MYSVAGNTYIHTSYLVVIDKRTFYELGINDGRTDISIVNMAAF